MRGSIRGFEFPCLREKFTRLRFRSQPRFLPQLSLSRASNHHQLGLLPKFEDILHQITSVFKSYRTSRTVSQSRRVTHTQRQDITSPHTQTCRPSLPAPPSATPPPPAADNSPSSTRCAASPDPLSRTPLSDFPLPTTPRLPIGVVRPRG